jgi:putative transposase
MGIRRYVAYPLSTRHVEALMEERGVEVDHSTMNRWVIKYSPQLEEAFLAFPIHDFSEHSCAFPVHTA